MSDTKDDDECGKGSADSLCNLDRRNNMWVEGGDPSKGTGICLLDTWSKDAVIYSLQHNPGAKADLLKVTNDPELVELANTVELLSTGVEADNLQSEVNRNKELESYPFYGIFRGQPPHNG